MHNINKPFHCMHKQIRSSGFFTQVRHLNIVINCVTCVVTYRQKEKKNREKTKKP